jgi:phosphate transport system substrate-binding protein
MWSFRKLAPAAAAAVLAAGITVVPGSPAYASEPINGGGSTWSAVAISQWQQDIARQGVTVNYQATGSTAGRQGFYNSQYDFAVSEIPFQPKYCSNPADPSTCTDEISLVHRPFLYMPIVAGGTSILYNLQIDGQQFTKLQLSPKTLTEIFTGVVTNWNAPDIAADNPGVNFPDLPITPVVRSDGSGTSYQFTAYMANQEANLWNAFCLSQGIKDNPCPPTSQYPAPTNYAAQSGSDGVANFVAAPYNNGAIGYAESAYGIERGVPLASLLNVAGQYVQPTARNVAVALTKAVINPDHTQNLLAVYVNPDPRTYPMSSYSYMIVPTSPVTYPMDTSKGTTLGQFILYFLCQGQQEAAPLGYSPLPPNLVQLGFDVEAQVPGAPPPPPINQCNNPTITGNFLAQVYAPPPPTTTPAHTGSTSATHSTGPSGPGSTLGYVPGTTGPNGQHAGTSTTGPNGTTPGPGSTAVNPLNPQASSDSTGLPGVVANAQLAFGRPQKFGKGWHPLSSAVAFLVTLVLVAVALGPPVVSVYRKRRA